MSVRLDYIGLGYVVLVRLGTGKAPLKRIDVFKAGDVIGTHAANAASVTGEDKHMFPPTVISSSPESQNRVRHSVLLCVWKNTPWITGKRDSALS